MSLRPETDKHQAGGEEDPHFWREQDQFSKALGLVWLGDRMSLV